MIKAERHTSTDDQLPAARMQLANAKDRPCTAADADLEEWFPNENNRAARSEAARAVRRSQAARLCAGCPVRALCLDVSIRGEEWFGVWGGTSESDRRELIRQRKPSRPAATDSPAEVAA